MKKYAGHFILFLNLIFLIFLKNSFAQLENLESEANNESVKEVEIDVVLGIDKTHDLSFVPYRRVQVGRSDILDYVLIPNRQQIIFKGLRPGTTSVLLWNNVGELKARFKIQVTSTSLGQVVSELKEYLGEVEGLDIGIKGKNVFVGGEIVVPQDVGKINTILERYPDVIQLYELSPHTQVVIANKMQSEMQKFGLKDVTVRVVNKVFWLEGVVTKDSEKALAQEIAVGLAPDDIAALSKSAGRSLSVERQKIVNFISINPAKQEPPPPPKLIKVTANFVELSKDYSRVFGFKWTPTLAPGGGAISFGKTTENGVTAKSNGVFSGTIANLFPRLAAAKSAGYARVIQSGMVIMQNAIKAQLIKNTSVPFTLGTGEFQQAAKVETGFDLSVLSNIVGKDDVEMQVGLGVTMGHGNQGTSRNTLSTTILVKSTESAVLGGIAVNEGQTSYDKDPPFGADTVDQNTGFPLFSFLRSKSINLNKSQFVVFITPEIIDSPAKTTQEIKKKFIHRRR